MTPNAPLTADLVDDDQFLSAIINTQNDIAAIELDAALIIRMVADRIRSLTHADGGAVHLMDGGSLVCQGVSGQIQSMLGHRFNTERSLCGQAVKQRRDLICSDVETDDRVDLESCRRTNVRSLAATPMFYGGAVIGALNVVSFRPNAFGPRQLTALKLMGGLVAAALTHASEFEIKKKLLAERTATLSALCESENRFRHLVEQAADAVFLVESDGRIVDVNERACMSLGYCRDEMLRMRLQDIEVEYPVPGPDGTPSYIVDAPATIQGRHRRRDGSTFPVEVRIGPIETGGRRLSLGIARDVSERLKTEAALRDSEERFRSAFDSAAIGMALVSLDGRWLQVNRSVCRIVGYTEHELLVRDFQSITFPDDLDADVASTRQLIAGEILNHQMIKRYIHRDGHLVWVLLTVSLVRGEGGKPLYFISQIQDITQRKRAEEALRDSENEYRAIFELAGVGKVQTDLSTGRLLRVNQKLCEMLGYSEEELQCMRFAQITHADDLAKSAEAEERMARGEIVDYTTERRYLHRDGRVIWTILNATVLRDPSGKPVKAVSTLQDITESKHAQRIERDRRRVLEMVARDLPLPDVLGQLAQTVERQTEGSVGAIMVVQEGEISLHGPNLPADWRAALEQHALHLASQLADGVWSAEDRCGITSVDTHPDWAALRPLASRHGFQRCWTVGIQSTDGGSLGLVTVFTPQSRPPTAMEVQTLDMAAKLATICIDHHNTTSQLAHLVRHDRLTGLPNRLMFEDRVQQALELARRNDRHAAVMLLDIDKFKSINDTLGHDAGDQLLQQFAARLRNRLRLTDTMARLGGDEFVIVLPEVGGSDEVSVVAQKLIDALHEPFDLSSRPVKVTTSIGLALFPRDGQDAVTLQKKADLALYRVKKQGRNGHSY